MSLDWNAENTSASESHDSSSSEEVLQEDDITANQIQTANNGINNESQKAENPRLRRKRRYVDTKDWSQEKNKKRRETGLKYSGKRRADDVWIYDIPRPEKVLQERCKCTRNVKSKLKCSQFTEKDRKLVFEQFWKMSWKEKKLYITMLVERKVTERCRNRKNESSSRRTCTYIFYLKKEDGTKIRVCKSLFANTLAMKLWTINNWLKENLNVEDQKRNIQTESEENVKNRTENNRDMRQKHLTEFFESLPKMESHYCRSSSAKLYLEPIWKSKGQLYELYKNYCLTNHNNGRPLSVATFHHKFSDLNLSLFVPKKDECDLCVSYRTKNVEEEVYISHQKKKEEARGEKDQDKNNSSDEYKVYTMDMQAVMLAPKSNVSALYYKTKLAVHNFTFYDLKTKEGSCFIWHESEGGLTASVYASIVTKFLCDEIDKYHKPYYILYSDGCTSQNRNVTMSNALLNLSMLKNVNNISKIFGTRTYANGM